MKLNEAGVSNSSVWTEKGFQLPKYDRSVMIEKTKANPQWIHFGAGNIFRAFQAAVAQNLLNDGSIDTGIVVVEGYDYEIIEKAYRPNDNYSILVTLKSDGTIEKTVIGSIAESCILDSDNSAEFGRLKDIFANKSLQMATFTITEKGYSLKDGSGNLLPLVEKDMMNGPEKPESYIGKVAALLYHRFSSGKLPIAFVSTDNCSHNGDKLKAAMVGIAEAWIKNGKADASYMDYLNDEKSVSFPWSMIDKITPRPDASVENILKKDGLEGLEPVITSKSTYVAPFVNAEETEYLVIEDKFPNGRMALEKGGVIFTERETVDKVERMKVCTCLNPLHTSLAVYGCLLGYTKIFEEMKDEDLVSMIKTIGYKEGLPVVVDPGVLNPKEFIDTVIGVRLPNPFMPDAPQRIATDTSQKLNIRFGETIKNYTKQGRDLNDLKLIPLVFAGWLRYLMAVDDKLNAFELSTDPMLDELKPIIAKVNMGDDAAALESKLHSVLSDAKIFGSDLYTVKLSEGTMADKVIGYLVELLKGEGAVRATLHKYVA